MRTFSRGCRWPESGATPRASKLYGLKVFSFQLPLRERGKKKKEKPRGKRKKERKMCDRKSEGVRVRERCHRKWRESERGERHHTEVRVRR